MALETRVNMATVVGLKISGKYLQFWTSCDTFCWVLLFIRTQCISAVNCRYIYSTISNHIINGSKSKLTEPSTKTSKIQNSTTNEFHNILRDQINT